MKLKCVTYLQGYRVKTFIHRVIYTVIYSMSFSMQKEKLKSRYQQITNQQITICDNKISCCDTVLYKNDCPQGAMCRQKCLHLFVAKVIKIKQVWKCTNIVQTKSPKFEPVSKTHIGQWAFGIHCSHFAVSGLCNLLQFWTESKYFN